MADVDSTATAARRFACALKCVDIVEAGEPLEPSIPPAIMFKTRGHPLARMHGDWGAAFVGTKAELQAAGFGVGAVFPGEPGGNKKKAMLPACNGFPRVEVELYSHLTSYLGGPSQTGSQNYVIHARYSAENFKETRVFEPTQWPGVALHRSMWCDVYRGTMDALIAANLADAWQFPGQPGCGKVRTTFSSDGVRVVAGSNTASQEGNRTVLLAGKMFEVRVQVSDAERDMRREASRSTSDAKRARAEAEIGALFAKHRAESPRPHLRLVWSA